MKKLNLSRVIFISLMIFMFAIVSFVAAWAKDESTLGQGYIRNAIAQSYNIFAFPTLTHLQKYFIGGWLYFIGLLINCVLYALIIEVVISNLIKKSTG